jgi:hypothetical protein
MRYILRRPRAFWISVCNLVGLLCSIVGVLLLVYFALPVEVPGGPSALGASGPSVPNWEAEVQRYARMARIGLVLVIAGTLMEMVPPLCTAIGSWRRRPIAPSAQTPRETPMDPELEKVLSYAQKVLDAAIDVVGAARVELNESWARDPKIVGLTILCRSITNFRAAALLVQQEHPHVLEANALVRLLYENLLWVAALKERGPEFVQNMREDEAFNRKALVELTLELNRTQGGDVSGPAALKLRNLMKDQSQRFPKPKKLNARETAAAGGVEMAYQEYVRLSLDAVHCSVTALGYHLSSEHTPGNSELVLSVVPRAPPGGAVSTVLHACRALIPTARGADELIGCTTAGVTLAALEAEFVSNGWLER